MTMTALDRVPAMADAGVVGDEQPGRPDPEVPAWCLSDPIISCSS
jgi:hypothetical protein